MIGAVLGGVLLAGAVVVGLLVTRSDDPKLRGGGVGVYLGGEGKLVATFRDVSFDLVALDAVNPDERLATCERIASALDASVDPTGLYEAASGIPDAALAEIAVNERSARSALLIACANNNEGALRQALSEVKALDEAFRAHTVKG